MGNVSSVLIVENEAPLTRLMSWFLIEAGHTVMKADSGDEAVSSAGASHPAVVVFNTSAPAGVKADWICRIHASSPDTRVLDVSNPDHRPMDPPESGADSYLQMPFHADTLIQAVAALVDPA